MTRIIPGDLVDPQVIALLDTHRNSALMVTPGEKAFAIYLSRLKEPNITLFGAWDAVKLLGIGALCELTTDHGEVKYMHTTEGARRQGVGSKLLSHILGAARKRGYSRISLETGSRDAFAPARALYWTHGFVVCAPFGDYELHPVSVFMTLDLAAEPKACLP